MYICSVSVIQNIPASCRKTHNTSPASTDTVRAKNSSHCCCYSCQSTINEDASLIIPEYRNWCVIMPPQGDRAEALSNDACLTSVAYIGPKSITKRPRKTKIGTEVTHFTRDSDITFKVKRST